MQCRTEPSFWQSDANTSGCSGDDIKWRRHDWADDDWNYGVDRRHGCWGGHCYAAAAAMKGRVMRNAVYLALVLGFGAVAVAGAAAPKSAAPKGKPQAPANTTPCAAPAQIPFP